VRPVLEGTLSGDTFTVNNRYIIEGNSYYDPLISASIGGSNRYYLYDGLGSTRQLLDSNQTVTDTYAYEAFGNNMGSTGTTPNPYRYVGSLGYYQTGSSLMHLGARYYMPEIGRFLQRDPSRLDAYPYAYALGNPVLSRDPSGLFDREYCVELCKGYGGDICVVVTATVCGVVCSRIPSPPGIVVCGVVCIVTVYLSCNKGIDPACEWACDRLEDADCWLRERWSDFKNRLGDWWRERHREREGK
jgi:RHS repeat-associated protein